MSRTLRRSQRRAPSKRRLALRLSILAAVAVFGALTALNAGDAPSWTAFEDIVEALVAVLATVACLPRARRERAASTCSAGV